MLGRITEEITRCLDNECYIAALSLALTIPDVCGKAEYPTASVTERYIKWYNENMGQYEKSDDPNRPDDVKMPYMSGEVLYNLRNSLLHQGTPSIEVNKIKDERCKVDSFILTVDNAMLGGSSTVSYGMDRKIEHRALEINIVNLCVKLVAVARGYYKENADKFNFFQYTLRDNREVHERFRRLQNAD